MPSDASHRLRLIIADRRAYRASRPGRSLPAAAGYLEHVADELDQRGVPVGSVEIDMRGPVSGKLVLTGVPRRRLAMPAGPAPLTLHWDQERGWTVARSTSSAVRHPIARVDIEPEELASRLLTVLQPGLLRPAEGDKS